MQNFDVRYEGIMALSRNICAWEGNCILFSTFSPINSQVVMRGSVDGISRYNLFNSIIEALDRCAAQPYILMTEKSHCWL